ncbi:MAG: hypothetical protein D6679_05375 [Candidatus Hydrogenedentota bacterium]|nr:MAG: hypothetical protein D6679_05375 [Candidatus Hydrogenedentota bacterium]
MGRRFLFLSLVVVLPLTSGSSAVAGDFFFTVLKTSGDVKVRLNGKKVWTIAHERMPLREGDAIRTGRGASAILRFGKRNHTVLSEKTTAVILAARAKPIEALGKKTGFRKLFATGQEKKDIVLYQLQGEMGHFARGMRNGSEYRVVTPVSVAAVRGTEFFSNVDPFSPMPVNTLNLMVDLALQSAAHQALDEIVRSVINRSSDFNGLVRYAVISGLIQVWRKSQLGGTAINVGAGQMITISSGGAAGTGTQQGSNVKRGTISQKTKKKAGEEIVTVQNIKNPANGKIKSAASQIEQTNKLDTLKNASIANFPSLPFSLDSFLAGSVTYDMLDSFHPINGGTLSWKNFTRSEIQAFNNTL